jgi:RNA polymerase sigma factor (sigma-70 family)
MRNVTAPILRHIRSVASASVATDAEALDAFVSRTDESAFAMLVRRHGPIVFRICNSVLRDVHEVEDAFQATFLTLARHAGAVRKRGSLKSWIYKVARRTAIRAKQRYSRRTARELESVTEPVAPSIDGPSWREVQRIFFEELARISECYRAPLILCCLEGNSRDEAAVKLGCLPGTLKIRLERGRGLLRSRLTRRGITLSAGFFGVLLDCSEASAVPPALMAATCEIGQCLHAEPGMRGRLPERVESLYRDTARSLWAGKLVAILLLTVSTIAAVGFALFAAQSVLHASIGSEQPADARSGADNSKSLSERMDADGEPMPADAISRLGTLRMRHESTFIRYLSDGKTIISQDRRGLISLFDTTSGKIVRSFPPDTEGNAAVSSVSTDGKYFAKAGDFGIDLWNVASASKERRIRTGAYSLARFTPNGKYIAALPARPACSVELLDIASGSPLWSNTALKAPPTDVVVAPDEKSIIACSLDEHFIPSACNAIYFLDFSKGEERRRIDLGAHMPETLAISPNCKYLAAICLEGEGRAKQILVWQTSDCKKLYQLNSPPDEYGSRYFSALTFSPDSRTLLTASTAENLVEWDAATGKELRRLGGVLWNSDDLRFSPDGKTIAVANGGAIRLIDRASGEDRTPGTGTPYRISSVAMSADGRSVTLGSAITFLSSWDPTTGHLQQRARLPIGERFVHPGSDGTATSIHVGGNQGTSIRIWDLSSGQERRSIPLKFADKLFSPSSVSRADNLVAVAGDAGDEVWLLDTRTAKRVSTIKEPGQLVLSAELADDGRKLVVCSTDRTVRVWHVASREKLRQFKLIEDQSEPSRLPVPIGDPDRYATAVSPDGSRLAYLLRSGRIIVYDTASSGQAVRTLDSGASRLNEFGFSPDNRTLFCGYGNLIHVIELASGKTRAVLNGHRAEISVLRITADGKTLISGSADTTAIVWDLTGLRTGKIRDQRLTDAEFDADWATLAGEDAQKAYDALRALAAPSSNGAQYIRQRLQARKAPEKRVLDALIADLDSAQFVVREKAKCELEKLGDGALPSCRAALREPISTDVRRLLETIVAKCELAQREPRGENLREARAIEALESNAGLQAREILEVLAAGLPEARLTIDAKSSLARLARRSAGSK